MLDDPLAKGVCTRSGFSGLKIRPATGSWTPQQEMHVIFYPRGIKGCFKGVHCDRGFACDEQGCWVAHGPSDGGRTALKPVVLSARYCLWSCWPRPYFPAGSSPGTMNYTWHFGSSLFTHWGPGILKAPLLQGISGAPKLEQKRCPRLYFLSVLLWNSSFIPLLIAVAFP